MKLKPKTVLAIAAAMIAPPLAIAGTYSWASSPGVIIPDGSDLGVIDTINVAFAEGHTVTGLRVTLDISGGYNGDLFAYLYHESGQNVGFSVLLNRPGRTASDPDGYPDTGFNITFDDSATADIHSYRLTLDPNGGVLTGIWQPDARTASPYSVFETSDRSAFLSSFLGHDPRGDWTLFVADVSPVGVSKLNSWSIEIVAAPEPGSLACAAVMGLTALTWQLRRKKHAAKATKANINSMEVTSD
ncbi:MAG TPA: PEP-CTERM sorting domain-containing protein [Verrucomicrobiota bacterium]|nr:PEP-CTERM sorting domain-containing protein [Verrucomicrobiota bacterium]